MFTGIITNLGKIQSLDFNDKKDLLIEISTPKDQIKRNLEIGCSISCNGICLTLTEKKTSDLDIILSFYASDETLQKTNLKSLAINDIINLEFAMQMGDEFGGHMVLGHVDDLAKIISIKEIKDSHQFTFETKNNLMKFIAKKGSATINGASLTVNEIKNNNFEINIIKHTLENTNFNQLKTGDLVNLEIDMVARYLERLC